MATVFERVRKIVVEHLGVEVKEVKPESRFIDDLNADSLGLVELIMALEEEFSTDENKIEIPDEDTEKIRTFQEAVDYIKSRGIKDE